MFGRSGATSRFGNGAVLVLDTALLTLLKPLRNLKKLKKQTVVLPVRFG